VTESNKQQYSKMVKKLGKKQFTLLKMLEYGFWPKNVPTPYEKQVNESEEDQARKEETLQKYKGIINQISKLYKTKSQIQEKLRKVRIDLAGINDVERIRKELAKQLWQESIKRREERKKQRELEKKQKTEAWQKKKKEEIVFVGKGYSSMLYRFEEYKKTQISYGLPLIKDAHELAKLLDIEYKQLRFLTYHRDVVTIDHYTRYTIPKRKGGTRSIAAPKSTLKKAQRAILDKILSNIEISVHAHGFLEKKSVITGAKAHPKSPYLLINMDLKDFFPTITFERIRGMYMSLGYSGHIATLLAMICSYCERMPIEIQGETKFVASTRRILPQGSPASPMITNVICRRLDNRLSGLAKKFGFNYTRYADDLSFSLLHKNDENIARFCGLVYKIVGEEDFLINKKKNRFLRENNQQKITGIVINTSEIGIPRVWIKKFRAALHNAEMIKIKEGEIPEEKLFELSGMASWVKSVNSNRYKNLLNLFSKLIIEVQKN